MKKIRIVLSIMLLVPLLSACDESNDIELKVIEELIDDDLQESYEYSEDWGSVSALDTEILSLEAMLMYSIQDEYSAFAEYEYILTNFNITKPFSNIINAEASHIEMLLPLFDTYELQVPYNDAENHLLLVVDLVDTFRTGVIAEILNIDMYNLFLEQDLPDRKSVV